jgi:hypothetical protein
MTSSGDSNVETHEKGARSIVDSRPSVSACKFCFKLLSFDDLFSKLQLYLLDKFVGAGHELFHLVAPQCLAELLKTNALPREVCRFFEAFDVQVEIFSFALVTVQEIPQCMFESLDLVLVVLVMVANFLDSCQQLDGTMLVLDGDAIGSLFKFGRHPRRTLPNMMIPKACSRPVAYCLLKVEKSRRF